MTTMTRKATNFMALLIVLTGLAASTYSDGVKSNFTKTDFGPYLATAKRMRAGDPMYAVNAERIYTTEQYVYPPTPALLFRSIATMPIREACKLWLAINVCLMIGIIGLYCFVERINPLKETALTILFCLTAFEIFPSKLEIFIGNLDLFVLACLIGVTAFSRSKRFVASALMLSLAASIKTWGLFFALYLIYLRKWKEAVLAGIGFGAVNAVIFYFLGFDEFVSFVQTQKLYAVQPKLNSNAIIPMCHLFAGEPQFEHHRVQVLFPGAQTILPIVGDVAALSVFVVSLLVAWRLGKSPRPAQMSLLMSLCIMTILLLTPLCHQYYYVMALPVIWNLIVYSDSVKRVGRVVEDDVAGVLIWGGAFLAALLLLIESPGLMEPNAVKGFGDLAPFGYGTTIIAGLILWICCVVAVYSSKDSQSEALPLESSLLASEDKSLLSAV